jgi:hypothetical protein
MRILSIAILVVLALSVAARAATTDQTTLVGTAVAGADTLNNCRVTITLAGAKMFFTSTLAISAYSKTVYADANGYFRVLIFGTDSLTAVGSSTPTYVVKYEHPILKSVIELSGLSITANADTTILRDVLAQ